MSKPKYIRRNPVRNDAYRADQIALFSFKKDSFACIVLDKRGLFEVESFSTLFYQADSDEHRLHNAHAFIEIQPNIHAILDGRIWALHGTQSVTALQEEFELAGVTPPSCVGVLDTLDLLKKNYRPVLPEWDLPYLAQHFGLTDDFEKSQIRVCRVILDVLYRASTSMFLESAQGFARAEVDSSAKPAASEIVAPKHAPPSAALSRPAAKSVLRPLQHNQQEQNSETLDYDEEEDKLTHALFLRTQTPVHNKAATEKAAAEKAAAEKAAAEKAAAEKAEKAVAEKAAAEKAAAEKSKKEEQRAREEQTREHQAKEQRKVEQQNKAEQNGKAEQQNKAVEQSGKVEQQVKADAQAKEHQLKEQQHKHAVELQHKHHEKEEQQQKILEQQKLEQQQQQIMWEQQQAEGVEKAHELAEKDNQRREEEARQEAERQEAERQAAEAAREAERKAEENRRAEERRAEERRRRDEERAARKQQQLEARQKREAEEEAKALDTAKGTWAYLVNKEATLALAKERVREKIAKGEFKHEPRTPREENDNTDTPRRTARGGRRPNNGPVRRGRNNNYRSNGPNGTAKEQSVTPPPVEPSQEGEEEEQPQDVPPPAEPEPEEEGWTKVQNKTVKPKTSGSNSRGKGGRRGGTGRGGAKGNATRGSQQSGQVDGDANAAKAE